MSESEIRRPRGGRPDLLAAVLGACLVVGTSAAPAATQTKLITLTQVPCQFLESENGVDHEFVSKTKADCEEINARTARARLAEAKVLELAPGRYVFRVLNKNVPYELGFWLREKDYDWRNPVHKLTKVSVSGGGLYRGQTKDYAVDLEPGEYLYSCPLNPTPDYRIVVSE